MSADALRKALEKARGVVSFCNNRRPGSYATLLTEIDTALSADAALSQPQMDGDLAKTIVNVLSKPDGDAFLIWLDQHRAALSQQGMVERGCMFCRTPIAECMGFVLARDALTLAEGRVEHGRELCSRCAELVSELFISPQLSQIIPADPERIAGSGRDAVADDLLTPQEARQNLMDKDDRNSPAEYQDQQEQTTSS